MCLAQQLRKLGCQRVAFTELCQDFIPSYKVSIFIIEYLVAHQFSDFFKLKSYSVVLELFGIKELDLSDTNQQRGSTEL